LGQEEKGADMARNVVADIRRATRRKLRAEEKIPIVLKACRERFPSGKEHHIDCAAAPPTGFS